MEREESSQPTPPAATCQGGRRGAEGLDTLALSCPRERRKVPLVLLDVVRCPFDGDAILLNLPPLDFSALSRPMAKTKRQACFGQIRWQRPV